MEEIHCLFWSNYWGWTIHSGKNSVYFIPIGFMPSPLCGKSYITSHRMEKSLICNHQSYVYSLYQITKNISAEITPHISSVLDYLGVVFERLLFIVVPNCRMKTLRLLKTNYLGHIMNIKMHKIMWLRRNQKKCDCRYISTIPINSWRSCQ